MSDQNQTIINKMKTKIISGFIIILGISLVSIMTPYPKELFCIIIGILLLIGGLVKILDEGR